MKSSHANFSATIADLKQDPAGLIKNANDLAIAILNDNQLVAYLVSASAYERLVDEIDEYELAKIVARRREKVSTAVEVNIDDL
ncbi:MAG: type II toxin-antitoxin system Phd/YefM family antitoxin [Pseudoalteromonas prydzensis]|uniref:type II toxin-antitoxin system Phd/YefM family antitoxin n=1 Tax=Pseudoalteromonas prydzensis TaxID=182141 RepID=UPI003F983A83